MAETEANKTNNSNTVNIRDPKLVKNRIFVGNLPSCTREELESICLPYGNILGSLVQKNFGFVQFESEEIANRVATALSRSSFKGHTITVRNAGSKQAAQKAAAKRAAAEKVTAGTNSTTDVGSSNKSPDYNDCEIIVVDRKNTKYAEFIEDRLKQLNLRVDVLFPNEDVPLGKVLTNISSRGCLYAILVTNQHEEHNSITVNILYGQPAEHRNMPMEDAINLITDDFRKKMARDAVQQQTLPMHIATLPKSVPIIPATNNIAPPLKDRHPESIQILLNLLADNMPLTVLQYNRIIEYLQERREFQMKAELGDDSDITDRVPDPEIELQKKILKILNKPSIAETHYDLFYPSLDAVKDDYRVMELLRDMRVQKALDSLLDSNLVGTVENYMKF